VKTVINFWVPYNLENFYLSEELLAAQEGLCLLELVGHLLDHQLLTVTSKLPYETGDSYGAILYIGHKSLHAPCISSL